MVIAKDLVHPRMASQAYRDYVQGLEEKEFVPFFFGCDEASLVKTADWDFSSHVSSVVMPYLESTKISLEIGCGCGRLLAPASRYFDLAVGLDIHSRHDLVKKYLDRRETKNGFSLTYDGKNFPVKNCSVSLVYSVYSFTYVGELKFIVDALAECRRVLQSNGIALIYYGVRSNFAADKQGSVPSCLDRIIELFPPMNKVMSIGAPVNHKNLFVPEIVIRRVVRNLGFHIVTQGRSRRLFYPPRWAGQRYMLLRAR